MIKFPPQTTYHQTWLKKNNQYVIIWEILVKPGDNVLDGWWGQVKMITVKYGMVM